MINTSEQTVTAYLLVTSQNFMQPTGSPVTLSAALGGTIANPGVGGSTIAVLGAVSSSNASGAAILASPLNTGWASSTFTSGSTFSSSAVLYPVSLDEGPYSVGEELQLTLGAGAHVSLDATSNLSAPEPATWAMMALGFAGLGFAGWRRARTGAATVFDV